MTTFHKFLRATIEQAGNQAQADRSTTIEAQHLLLAIAARQDTAAARLLSSAGLDHAALRQALDREFEHSLSAAGVALTAFDLPRPTGASQRVAGVGASVQIALQRGLTGLRKAPRPEHLLLGILLADVGTVPRALALAGIDRASLLVRVQQTLSDEGRAA